MAAVAAQRQRLPIDVAQPDRATIGGAVALNAAGPRRYAYGTMRDYLLGFTAVDGTGMTFSGGGRVVKNAAGYNMCRLMAGSLGTLGIVTQVTLMVRPLPEASALLVCEVPDFNMAEKLLAAWFARRRGRWPSNCRRAGPGEANRCWPRSRRATSAGCTSASRGPRRKSIGWSSQLREEWAALGMLRPCWCPLWPTDRLWRWLAEFPANVQIDVLPSRRSQRSPRYWRLPPTARSRPMPATA